MKRLIFSTVAFCSLFVSDLIAQKKFDTYYNAYSKKTYDIKISDGSDLYIDAFSFDVIHEFGGINIKNEDLKDFRLCLEAVKVKYQDYINVAKTNNVKELNKTIDEITPEGQSSYQYRKGSSVGGYFQYGKDWHFQFNVPLKYRFVITNSQYLLIIQTGELTASDNQFMKVDGFALIFTDPDEISSFLNKISIEKIKEFLNKPKPEDLFK